MKEITLTVEHDEGSGRYVASWDAPRSKGGITTQSRHLCELQDNVTEAVACYFDEGKAPRAIRLHFVKDPILTPV